MNRMFMAALAGLTLSACVLVTAPTAAHAPSQQAAFLDPALMNVAIVTPLPMKYFCAQHPGECRAAGPARVTVTPEVLVMLDRVNRQVNRAIRPRRDAVETWSLNPSRGDCNDYVVSKRSALMKLGVPAGALRIAITRTRAGEPHAVLVVRTDQGDFVLDNLTGAIRTVGASGYAIRAVSSPNPLRWTAAG